jgi:hypothetical protein
MVKSKRVICDGCMMPYNRNGIVYMKGKFLCSHCKAKRENTKIGHRLPFLIIPLNEALDKIYFVRGHVAKDFRYANGYCYFPRILIGKKFKVVLVEEENEG